MVQSYSGGGKQIAIAILILSRVKTQQKYPHILYVTPSMEAAFQAKQTVSNVMMGMQANYSVHLVVAEKKIIPCW